MFDHNLSRWFLKSKKPKYLYCLFHFNHTYIDHIHVCSSKETFAPEVKQKMLSGTPISNVILIFKYQQGDNVQY